MAKYKFIKYPDKNNSYDRTKVIITTEAECIEQILEDFEDFLRGSAFHPNGTLEVVKEESGEDE